MAIKAQPVEGEICTNDESTLQLMRKERGREHTYEQRPTGCDVRLRDGG